MTDRPIIFSGSMVRALLEGRKTQTRRLLKIKGKKGFFQFGVSDTKGFDWTFRRADHVWEDYRHEKLLGLLPIQVGDRLYVREAFRCNGWATDVATIFYRASEGQGYTAMCEQFPVAGKIPLRPDGKWSPSIHMPRWASRLTLTVTDVRVQRLQDISEADVLSEGAPVAEKQWSGDGSGNSCLTEKTWRRVSPHLWFHELWNSLHCTDAWDANPWIYAVSFNVQRGNIDTMKRT